MVPFYQLDDRDTLPGIHHEFIGVPGTEKLACFFVIHGFDFRPKCFLPKFILSVKSNITGLDFTSCTS